MSTPQKSETGRNTARLCIWTIRNHNFLVRRFRLYMWSAAATVLFLAVAGVIKLELALFSILFGALCIVIILWLLIERRKTCLLNIQDPDLKRQAHAAMIEFIRERKDQIKNKGRLLARLRHSFGL